MMVGTRAALCVTAALAVLTGPLHMTGVVSSDQQPLGAPPGASAAPQVSTVATYSPILMTPGDEPNLPANVDWFLQRTRLGVHDEGCTPTDVDLGVPTYDLLESASYTSPCSSRVIRASGTRSAG